LQLWVHPNGSKLWRLAYRFGRKQKLLSLGPYPTVSLSDAREEREKAKKLLLKGIDPSEARKSAKAEQLTMLVTFRSIAEELLALQTRNGRAEVTLEKTSGSRYQHPYQQIGRMQAYSGEQTRTRNFKKPVEPAISGPRTNGDKQWRTG
jgi:hypothetical protein